MPWELGACCWGMLPRRAAGVVLVGGRRGARWVVKVIADSNHHRTLFSHSTCAPLAEYDTTSCSVRLPPALNHQP